MKSPQHKQEESSASVVQRLLHKKKLTNETYRALENNKTAQDRRLNEFGKESEKK
jgi:hypothetical protein